MSHFQFHSQRYAIFCRESPHTTPPSVDLRKFMLIFLLNFISFIFTTWKLSKKHDNNNNNSDKNNNNNNSDNKNKNDK